MCLSSVFASLLLQSERLQFTVWLGPTSLGVFFFFFFFLNYSCGFQTGSNMVQ